jgi:hypothetical protein
MLQLVLRLLGVDIEHKLAKIGSQIEEFRARTTRQIAEQIKQTGLVVGFALVGTGAAVATFIIALVGLYRWVDLYKGPFAALAAVGAVTALLAAGMFVLASRGKPPETASRVARGGRLTAAPPELSASQPWPVSAALSAAVPSLPPNASVVDVLTHRVSTRVAGAGDETIDAAVHLMRNGSRSVLFGTLAVVALVGVVIGRRR